MHCGQCGQALPMPLPKFCPNCGTPVAAAPIAPPPVAVPSNKPLWITLGLFAGAWITWGDGPSPGMLSALAWLLVLVLLVLDALNPAWWAQLPLPGWLRRPGLGSIASGVFALTTALVSGLSFGFLFWAAATVVFIRDAFQRGELGPFDPRQLWRGWRVLVLVGITLASLTFAATWEPEIYVSGWGGVERQADGDYWVNHSGFTMGGVNNAHAQGAATVPALIMLGVLVWAAYRGNGSISKWGRFIPVAAAPVLVIWAWRYMGTPGWVGDNPMASANSAVGPGLFLLMLAPYYVGAVALALGFNGWRKGT